MKNFNLFINKFMLIILLISMVLMLNTENFLLKWLLLEMSTITTIVFINFNNSNKYTSILYYIISSTVSMMIIMILISKNSQIFNLNNFDMNINILFQIMMLCKLGMFPFNHWMVVMYNKLNWEDIFIMSTFMKFIPLYFMINLLYLNMLIIIMLMISSLMIAMMAKYYNSIKKIIACSTINQISFMLMLMYFNKLMFMYYMFFYLIIFYLLCYLLNMFNLNNKIDMIMYNKNNINNKLIFIMFLIHAMLPPFSSFIIKWFFVNEIINQIMSSWWFFFILLLSSSIIIMSYLNLMENSMFKFKFNYNLSKTNMIKNFNISMMKILLISVNLFMFQIFYLI
uniref:NADH-ubiquinone oxidoreductase chain 2 n=1 Tax=Xylocopa appendiculata TaxID=135683 RepID=A0A343DRE0_9HYME|nr:NADH dehydrogenase subunit 2 [Xylocopa appendiculata]